MCQLLIAMLDVSAGDRHAGEGDDEPKEAL
jgi:hypothetical protein